MPTATAEPITTATLEGRLDDLEADLVVAERELGASEIEQRSTKAAAARVDEIKSSIRRVGAAIRELGTRDAEARAAAEAAARFELRRDTYTLIIEWLVAAEEYAKAKTAAADAQKKLAVLGQPVRYNTNIARKRGIDETVAGLASKIVPHPKQADYLPFPGLSGLTVEYIKEQRRRAEELLSEVLAEGPSA